MRPARLLAAAPALASALAAAGCGASAPTLVRGSVLRLRLDEYRIEPSNIRMRAGRLTIVASDTGILTHNVAIESPQRDPGRPFTEYARTRTMHPGQSATLTITLKPGTYRLACTISNHDDLGQNATLHLIR
jgi:plastocyanin